MPVVNITLIKGYSADARRRLSTHMTNLVSQFLGGTGLLIVVSVGLDLVQRIEAALLMRNQTGFLDSGEGGRAARIRSGRG